MLDSRRLRVLCEVARHGSFSGAAESLGYTQPAVSRQIATLEAEVGTTLIRRVPKGALLTDAGRLLVDRAEAILARLDDRLGGRLEHYRGYAEDYLEEALARRKKFDVITNDMRMDAREAARLLVQARSCLRPDGFIISTLKLPHAAIDIDPSRNLKEAIRLLEKHFAVVQARQLFHNRQEVTIIAAKPRP